MKNCKFHLIGLKTLEGKKSIYRAFLEDENVLRVKVSDDFRILEIKSKNSIVFSDLKKFLEDRFKGKYHVSRLTAESNDYLFLLSIFGLIFMASFFIARIYNFAIMQTYMGTYLIVFSLFKLIDIKGFVNSFIEYDLLAKKFSSFAISFPFLEFLLGFLYFYLEDLFVLNLVVFIVFFENTLGVLKVLRSKEKMKCACSGTFFRLNISKLTLFENILMIFMSLYMILF